MTSFKTHIAIVHILNLLTNILALFFLRSVFQECVLAYSEYIANSHLFYSGERPMHVWTHILKHKCLGLIHSEYVLVTALSSQMANGYINPKQCVYWI